MNSATPHAQDRPAAGRFAKEQHGFQTNLAGRHMQMIAIGGAIGTGLFLGAGSRLESAGPSLAIDYAVCGLMGWLILRFLGELVMYRPSSGSFVSYTREFYGEKFAYVSGWMYWLHWSVTSVADSTAIAMYVKWFGQYSPFIEGLHQGTIALVVVVTVVITNLISVKVFGEMEFWFALIKVAALVIFLIVGVCFVIFGNPTGSPTGFHLITENGGWFPHGVMPALVIMQGVVFAYAGIELVGTASGESADPRKAIPRAVNTVIIRILLFYVGSVLLLVMLLPHTAYKAGESPFVTFFSSIGVDAAAPIMELVVITAAASSLNAGLYSTGRILHSMSVAGSAPKFAGRIGKNGVPYGGIMLTSIIAAAGVVLNYVAGGQAFEIVLNISALGIVTGWASITLAHWKFVRLAKQGKYTRPSYRAPFAPYSNILIMLFLVAVLVLVALDYPLGTYTMGTLVIIIPALIAGWFAVRERVAAISKEHEGDFDFYENA